MTRAALTRLTWTVSASAAVVLVVGGAAGAHRVLRTPCAGSFPRCENVQLSPEGLQLLTAGGVSPATYATLALAIHLGAALVTFALAALMMWRRPTDPLAVTAAFTWLALGVTVAIGPDVLARDHAGVAVAVAVAWFVQGAALVPLMCLFPDGRFVPRFSRWVALAAVLYHLWIALRPQGAQERWQTVDSVVHLTEFAVVIAVQVYRYRADSGTVQRQQTRWVVYGLGVLASVMTVVGLIGLVGDTSTRPGTPGRGLLATVAVVGILTASIAFAVAILRYRLFDLDIVVNRTLMYGALTVGVVTLYAGVVFLCSRVIGSGVLASGVAAVVVALAAEPLRWRLQRTVDRLMYGDRGNPYQILSTLGRQLQTVPGPAGIIPAVTDAVRVSLRLPYAGIVLHDAPAGPSECPPPHAVEIPLTHHGATVGSLVVGPRAGEHTLSPRDLRLLHDLAAQAGPALHAAALSDQLEEVALHLQHSRERLVRAAADERRRLRRDLHDELAPTIAGLALTAGALRTLVDTDTASARGLADNLREGLRGAGVTIRHLVHGLRPASLDELGLAEALRARAHQLSPVGLPVIEVDIEPLPLPPLPAAVEVAAYRIVHEALMNVVRHAQASRCLLRVRATSELLVDIVDDGVGIAATSTPGIGLRSIRERADELSGTCSIGAADGGGTHVTVRLPLVPTPEVTR